MPDKMITILVPTFNEEQVLNLLYERLTITASSLSQYQLEILFVDDGSSDNTRELIHALAQQDTRVSYVFLSRNFGKEPALLAGLDAAQGDAVVIIDADLQDPPELIPLMVERWEAGVQDVYAKRRSRRGETFLKQATSKLYYRVLQKMTRVPVQIDTGDFRLLDRTCINALVSMRESERYTKGLYSWIGFRKEPVLYDRDPRAAGTTKWNYHKLVNLALTGITSFTTAPLRLATILGTLISFAAFAYLVVIVVRRLLNIDALAGYPSLMAVMLFLGGIQLLSLGLIGEYVGQIFTESKRRPPYFVSAAHPADSTKNG